jgi:hypothetical protein
LEMSKQRKEKTAANHKQLYQTVTEGPAGRTESKSLPTKAQGTRFNGSKPNTPAKLTKLKLLQPR